jgi:hypothetical protein
VSEDLLDSITSCGYQPFSELVYSDHRAYFIDFDTKLLFGSDTQKLPKPSGRGIHSKKQHQVTEYIKAKNKHLKNQNFFDRLKTFLEHTTIPVAEELDKLLVEASLVAAEKCKGYPPIPYSPEMIQLRLKFTIMVIKLHSLHTNRDMTRQLKLRLDKLDENLVLPDDVELVKAMKKQARKVLRTAELEEYRTHKL